MAVFKMVTWFSIFCLLLANISFLIATSDLHSFISWCNENDIVLNSKIEHNDQSEYGMYAARNMKVGERVLQVPIRHNPMILYDAVVSDVRSHEAPFREGVVESTLMVVYLLDNLVSIEDSNFKPYINLLPKNPTNFVHFTDDDMAWFQSSAFTDEIRDMQKKLRDQFTDASGYVSKVINREGKLSAHELIGQFQWASSIVMSRLHKVQTMRNGVWKTQWALVPAADMLNYAPQAESNVECFSMIEDDDVEQEYPIFVCETTKDVEDGSEFLTNYGNISSGSVRKMSAKEVTTDLDNVRSILEYGFLRDADMANARHNLFINFLNFSDVSRVLAANCGKYLNATAISNPHIYHRDMIYMPNLQGDPSEVVEDVEQRTVRMGDAVAELVFGGNNLPIRMTISRDALQRVPFWNGVIMTLARALVTTYNDILEFQDDYEDDGGDVHASVRNFAKKLIDYHNLERPSRKYAISVSHEVKSLFLIEWHFVNLLELYDGTQTGKKSLQYDEDLLVEYQRDGHLPNAKTPANRMQYIALQTRLEEKRMLSELITAVRSRLAEVQKKK